MTEECSPSAPPRQPRFQFGIASLLLLTVLVACILSVYRCLGPLYGWLSAIPLGIITVLLLYTRWHCTIGTVLGGAILSILGFYVVIRISPSDPSFVKAMVTLGSFGGAFGASLHAIILKQRIVGSILLVTSIIVFVASLLISIPVP